ncbi:O-antigen ligase [Caulobacter sp. 17J80-11]|uniref:O-antigen ligase family protein n=1 Tax=Caulobacter sp. 17J80-11 TaxID=2763502 RepID=UPI0016538733|nr:O-antigen ligase family protein [Caulobacter sp. 17J80-11]
MDASGEGTAGNVWPAHPAWRGRADASPASWLAGAATVFLLLIYSQAWTAPVTGWADAGDSSLLRNTFFLAYAASLFVLALEGPRSLLPGLRAPIMLGLVLFAFATTAWSIAPDATVRRALALTFTTLAGVALAGRRSWAGIAETLATVFGLVAVGSFLLGAGAPGYGRMPDLFPGAWRGLYLEKNALGGMMALGFGICAAAAVLAPWRRKLWSAAAGLCLLLVLLSTSKTSLMALLLGGAGMVFVWICRRGPVVAVVAVWAAVAGLAAAAAGFLLFPDVLFEVLGKDATFTGRTQIWEAAMRQLETRPWTGFGYGVLWDHRGPWDPSAWIFRDAGFKPGHAHNSWLETWLSFGLVGLVAWAIWFAEVWIRVLARLTRDAGLYLAVPVLIVSTLTSLTEVWALDYHDLQWSVFVAVAIKLARPLERAT